MLQKCTYRQDMKVGSASWCFSSYVENEIIEITFTSLKRYTCKRNAKKNQINVKRAFKDNQTERKIKKRFKKINMIIVYALKINIKT